MKEIELRAYRSDDFGVVRRWIFDPADRGRGGRAAQRVIADRLFGERGARRVQAETDRHNLPERRVVEALGFVEEGVARRYFEAEGDLGDLVMYAMTRDDWERTKDH